MKFGQDCFGYLARCRFMQWNPEIDKLINVQRAFYLAAYDSGLMKILYKVSDSSVESVAPFP